MSVGRDAAFWKHIEKRYKGKVWRVERVTNPMHDTLVVRVEFRIPADVDEIEMYRRINSVIDVIAEGNDGG